MCLRKLWSVCMLGSLWMKLLQFIYRQNLYCFHTNQPHLCILQHAWLCFFPFLMFFSFSNFFCVSLIVTVQRQAVAFHQNSEVGPEWAAGEGRESQVFHEAQAFLRYKSTPDRGARLGHWWVSVLLHQTAPAAGPLPCSNTAPWWWQKISVAAASSQVTRFKPASIYFIKSFDL